MRTRRPAGQRYGLDGIVLVWMTDWQTSPPS